MRVISIVGARPQFIKVAPVSWRANGLFEHMILHTGQHYDYELSENFFSELEIPRPFVNLNSGSGSQGAQTARILAGVEEVLLKLSPDWVLVYGDTNSTIAGALAAIKLGIRVGHVEAGLRSFNRAMPEEINRVGSDHISDLLFAPTDEAMENLRNEGLYSKSLLVGDVMVESLLFMKAKIEREPVNRNREIFATIHRAENTNSKDRLQEIIYKLSKSPVPVNLFAHPRLLHKARDFGIDLGKGSIRVFGPASYFETLKGIIQSIGVITDSGGLQKEAYLLERPCLTIRSETEWIETLEGNWNQLDGDLEKINGYWWDGARTPPDISVYGDQLASRRIVEGLIHYSS